MSNNDPFVAVSSFPRHNPRTIDVAAAAAFILTFTPHILLNIWFGRGYTCVHLRPSSCSFARASVFRGFPLFLTLHLESVDFGFAIDVHLLFLDDFHAVPFIVHDYWPSNVIHNNNDTHSRNVCSVVPFSLCCWMSLSPVVPLTLRP